MNKNLITLIVVISLTTGCASITRGTTDAFAIETSPPGATATMSNGLTCTTPCAMELPRKSGFTVKIEKDGYQTVDANIVPRQAGAGSAGMAGNVLLGGIIGMAVDSSTGAMKDLYPNPLVVVLEQEGSAKQSLVVLPSDEKTDESNQETVSEEDAEAKQQ